MKDPVKWCGFHKSPCHNIDECLLKQSLLDGLKSRELEYGFDYELEPNKGNQIIYVEPNPTNAAKQIKPHDLEDP